MSSELHRRTPSLAGICPRGLPVVTVAYHRVMASAEAEARIEHRSFDALGRLADQWDARLWADGGAAGTPNEHTVHGLSDLVLRSENADAGWRIALFGVASEGREGWDGRGTHRRIEYDDQLRLLSVVEVPASAPPCYVERYTYGASTEPATNRCGRIVRQDDPAGSRDCGAYGLHGKDLAQTQRFLTALEMPDWPEAIPERDALLETDEGGAGMPYTTRWAYDATGAVLSQTDAIGNAQLTCYNVAGQSDEVALRASGATTAMTLLHTRDYNASGQVRSETAGNGVITNATYSTIDGRLQCLQARRSDTILQDMRYAYDTVENVLSIADDVQPTDWFSGEQVDAVNVYRYDTLYQLVEASGRESAQASIGPGLPGLILPGGGDASRRRNYTQSYTYDAGGNLLTLAHTQKATRTMLVDSRSNRSLYMADAANPPDITTGFDANGTLLRLENMQTMAWNARNQLQRITQVVREDGPNDDEMYIYGGGGWRLRKVRVRRAKATQHIAQVKYLPGLEIRSDTATGEVLHVATVQAGRAHVRHLYWQQSRKALPTSQLRYSVDDHLGSSTLELDEDGSVVSHEGYYPYGGTAWWAARSEVDVGGKAIRYSRKERDATGLYYYGFRYYAPWLQRWINPDPAGDIDGPNRFGFVRNNPVSSRDADGRLGSPGGTEVPDDQFFAMEAAARNAPQIELVNLGYDGTPSPSPPSSPSSPSPSRSLTPVSAFIARLGTHREGSPAAASPTPGTSSVPQGVRLENRPPEAVPANAVLFTLPSAYGDIRVSTLVPVAVLRHGHKRCPIAGCSWTGTHPAEHVRRVHERLTPFACPQCGKGFSSNSNLNRHQKSHSEDRPFACMECGKSFRHKQHLTQHTLNHGQVRLNCTYEGCAKSYLFPVGLSRHINSAHKNIRYPCPGCYYQATQRTSLMNHRKRQGH